MKRGLPPAEGWLSLFLLVAMLASLAGAMKAVGWAEGLWVLYWVLPAGAVVGFILATLPLPVVFAHLLGLIFGALGSLLAGTLLLPEVAGWKARPAVLLARLGTWATEVAGGGMGSDNLAFVLMLAFACWLLGHLCAWYVFRQVRPWRVLVLSGLVLFINGYYAPQETLLLYHVVYLAAGLLLLARVNLARQERAWRREGVEFNPALALDFVRDGLAVAALVLALAWMLPQGELPRRLSGRVDFLFRKLEQPWNGVQLRFNRMFSQLEKAATPEARMQLSAELRSFTNTLELGEEPVLEVRATRGHYWRGQAYDEYAGWGWRNSDSVKFKLAPGDELLQARGESYRSRALITQTFRLLGLDAGLLYAAGEPLVVDRPVSVQTNLSPQDAERTGQPLVVSLLSGQEASLNSYIILSSVSQASREELEAAPSTYPAWVRARYLALPATLPQRVRELALQMAREKSSSYAKATALEAYLRTLPYSQKLPPPAPSGRDSVDYFLFESRLGQCYEHASAMVVLARAAGIPARLAAGYATGTYDGGRGVFVVRASEAHAWAEIYFPAYGWVVFEPTPSQPLIARAEPQPAGVTPPQPQYSPKRGLNWRFLLKSPTRLIGWGLVVLIGSSLLAVVGRALLWFVRVEGDTLVARAYERMARYARLWGVRRRRELTPLEYAQNVARGFPWGGLPAIRIAWLYVQERYGGRTSSPKEIREAQRELGRLRSRFWTSLLGRLFSRLGAMLRRIFD